MSDKKQGNAVMSTRFDNDVPGKSLSQVFTFNLTPRILSEHNYNVVPEAVPFKRNLRQMIVSIHNRTCPKESQSLPNSELSRLVHNGDVLLRRLRRLVDSQRRFIDFEPMAPLQEAIAEELAKNLGCHTRIYKGWNDSRYMVAYRPGVKPNAFELWARRMCQNDRGQEIYTVEVKEEEEEEDEDECPLVSMSFSDNKLHLHQPCKPKHSQMAENSSKNSLSLGRKIFEKFRREFQAIR